MTDTESGKTNGEADPASDFEQLKKDLRAIQKDFAALASSAGKVASAELRKMKSEGRGAFETAGGKAGDYRDAVADKVRSYPLAAVGAALVAGLALSMLGRR